MFKIAAFVLAALGLAAALRAAKLWLDASNYSLPPLLVSISDAISLCVLSTNVTSSAD